ncbi:uncharacterized protein LOC134752864 [Cydia strobilella]|uniref:uncharacterized protein LOC134752864 n=1 Tax=Cydia strobilella TaxID=1100964 RepID=UPI003003FF75
MNGGNSGAVFFLGTRAHYQVLNQPDRPFDVENGNSSQTGSTASSLWPDTDSQNNERWCNDNDINVNEDKDTGVKRRAKRRPSEAALCEDMRPAQLNGNVNDSDTPKSKGRRVNIFNAITSLARRKRRLQSHAYLKHLAALTTCTYRDSCRCLECQSRYFECDEDEESSEDDEYEYYAALYASQVSKCQHDDDNEVFIDTVPEDNASTDMLLDADEPKEKSVSSSDNVSDNTEAEPDAHLEMEVAAGTPIVLNYLLTHPFHCCIQ